MPSRLKDTLLLIGDENSCRPELRSAFEETYFLLEAESVPQAILLLEQNAASIALILMDLPAVNEETVGPLMAAAAVGTEKEIPTVVIVDAETATVQEEAAFLLGVTDVTIKPFSAVSIQRRVQILVEEYDGDAFEKTHRRFCHRKPPIDDATERLPFCNRPADFCGFQVGLDKMDVPTHAFDIAERAFEFFARRGRRFRLEEKNSSGHMGSIS